MPNCLIVPKSPPQCENMHVMEHQERCSIGSAGWTLISAQQSWKNTMKGGEHGNTERTTIDVVRV